MENTEQKIDFKNLLKKEFDNLISFEDNLPGSNELIKYRSMNTKDLKRMLLFENTNDPLVLEQIFDNLINSVVLTENFNIDNLSLNDRTFLLYRIRINSKGGTLSSTYKCSNCKQSVYSVQDLKSLQIIKKQENYNQEIKISDNLSLFVDFATRKEQKEYIKLLKSKNFEEKTVDLGLINLLCLIKYVKIGNNFFTDENWTSVEKIEFFWNLPEFVFKKLLDWENLNRYGINLNYVRTCPHCQFEEELDVSVNSLFS